MPGNSVICSSSEKLVGLHTTQANTNLGECGTWGRHGEIWDMGEMLAKLNNNSYKVYVQNEKKGITVSPVLGVPSFSGEMHIEYD